MKINLKKTALSCFMFGLIAMGMPALASPEIVQIDTELAPKAIGPYSQAIRAGSYIFVSGQIAIDPSLGKLTGDNIEEQTKRVLINIEEILNAQKLTLEHVVKTEVYLKDLKDFQGMNRIYAEKFSYPIKPARATVQISKLPLDALVEISCVAFIPSLSEN